MLVMSSMMFLHFLHALEWLALAQQTLLCVNSLGKPDYNLILTFGL